jgi:hypothetical protein
MHRSSIRFKGVSSAAHQRVRCSWARHGFPAWRRDSPAGRDYSIVDSLQSEAMGTKLERSKLWMTNYETAVPVCI